MMGGTAPGPAPGIGEFSASYEATLMPGNAEAWVINHRLGVMPKLITVKMTGTPTRANYGILAIYEMDVSGMNEDRTGYMVYKYYYNSTDYENARFLPAPSYIETTTTTATLKPVFSAARSSWDTGAEYRVCIYG